MPAIAAPRPSPPLDAGIEELLQVLGLARYRSYFEAEEIDVAALLLMDDTDVEELLVREKGRLRAALHCVSWSGISAARSEEEQREALSGEAAAAVRRILREPESEQAWRKLSELCEQLSARLAVLEEVFGQPVQRMVLEPHSGVTGRAVETVFFRVPIMLSLAREFAETRDVHVGQTLFSVLLLYLRNLEVALVLFFAMSAENARFAALVADIESDNEGDRLEQLLMYPLYFSLAVEGVVSRVAAADCRRPDAAALLRLASLAATAEAEGHQCGRALRQQEAVRDVDRRLQGKAARMPLAVAGRRFLHEGALMVARGGKLDKYYAFLFTDLLVLATQNTDLQFRYRDAISFEAAAGSEGGGAMCVERVADELGDFGLRLRSVHTAALLLPGGGGGSGGSEGGGIRFYASSREELDTWIDKGFAQAVAASAASGGSAPRTPQSGTLASRKERGGGGGGGGAVGASGSGGMTLTRQKSAGLLAKGLDLIRPKSGNKSPRGGGPALFE